ncbi:hypothetical protein ACQP1W_32985 [Spirillospora sp. CA-255316]
MWLATVPDGVDDDALQLRALHADGGGQVVTAGADVLGDVQDGAVRGGDAERSEAEPRGLHLLPHAQFAQDPQGVAPAR